MNKGKIDERMAYEYFYPGTPYSLEPESGGLFTGYKSPLGGFGLTTDMRTAAQLQEVSTKLNTGIKVIEVSAMDPNVLDAIPKQQLKEINRLTKLTGSEVTVHGPLIEASGYAREGWSESQRQQAEREMQLSVERAHELNPEGNIPVTFHSTAQLPEGLERVKEKVGEEWKEVPKSEIIIDPETGRLVGQLRERKRYFPGEPERFEPELELKKVSEESWRDRLTHLAFNTSRGSEFLREAKRLMNEEAYQKIKEGKLKLENAPEPAKEIFKMVNRQTNTGAIFLQDGYRELKEVYNSAYKSALEITEKSKNEEERKKAQEDMETLKKFAEEVQKQKEAIKDPNVLAAVMEEGLEAFNKIGVPRMFKPLNEFISEKSAQTFANVALNSYKQFGDKSPIISIENPPVGGGLSRAEDLKQLIEEARIKFVEEAKKQGISESEAKQAAGKLIGATWDVGHINMIRKYGYDKNDVVKETGKIAPFVKHVHLSDNFGMEHTELPMGMGNVPTKEIMEKLGKEGFEGKKIIEAFQWWQHVKTPPLIPTLEAFGSPLYPMISQPTWAQAANTYGSYFAFPSAYLPEQHFSLYGGGWATLPQELGGQIPGKQSRVTGTPMD